MTIKFENRTGREVFGGLQFGWWIGKNRALLKVTDYDYFWAKKEGLSLEAHEVLVRVENNLTEIKNGQVSMASIAKVNMKTGSIAFTKGEEGEEGFGWDRYQRANILKTEGEV